MFTSVKGGLIALVRDGDTISIDIPSRSITLDVPEAELARGAQHPLARDSENLSLLDVATIGHRRSEGRQGDYIARRHVESVMVTTAANNDSRYFDLRNSVRTTAVD